MNQEAFQHPIRYAIVGAGALGALYGGMLAKAGREVHFLMRSDADVVRRQGLTVDSVLGDFHLRPDQLHVHDEPLSVPPCDVTIVGLKTTQNHLLPRLLAGSTRPAADDRDRSSRGVVLCLQNGLCSEQDSVNVVGQDRVLGGCCFLCSNKIGPGHIRHIDYGRIVMGEFTSPDQPAAGVTPRVQSIVDDLRAARIDAHATGDLWAARWRKLMWNIPFNGLSVVLNASTRELIDTPATEQLATTIMHEVYAAARGFGRLLPEDSIHLTLEHTRDMKPYDSSMRLDYLAGRPMELPAIFEAPLAAAARAGIAMPTVNALYQQLSFLNRNAVKGER